MTPDAPTPGSGTGSPLDSVAPLVRFDAVDSTMLEARRRIARAEPAQAGAPKACFLVAREQTGGIGRHGRPWFSPPGGLWCTLAWPVPDGASPAPNEIAAGLGLRVGVVCLKVIGEALTRHLSPLAPMLKWPNDILVRRRKVCGSLCEAVVTPARDGSPRTTWFVVGVGVNVNNPSHELPEDLRRAPISMKEVAGREIDLEDLTMNMRAGLWHAVTTPGVDPETLRVARERLYGSGQGISVVAQGGVHMPGVLVGLNDAGIPVVRTGEIEFQIPLGSELL